MKMHVYRLVSIPQQLFAYLATGRFKGRVERPFLTKIHISDCNSMLLQQKALYLFSVCNLSPPVIHVNVMSRFLLRNRICHLLFFWLV